LILLWALRVIGLITVLLSISLLVISQPNIYAGVPGSGSNPSAPGLTETFDVNGFSGDVNLPPRGIVACDPVSSCPPIVKNINPFQDPPQTPPNPPAGSMTIHEEWINVGSIDWVDWHEQIQLLPPGTGGWIFTSVQISDCVGQMINKDSSISTDGTEVSLNFPPVKNGERLCIWKDVVFDPNFGLPPTPPQNNPPGPLRILEWPTIRTMAVGGEFIPIDATAVLIAGMQTNALSVLSAFVVIGAIAFGTLYFSVKRKRN